ncbi:hypothetical protein J5Y04_31380 [Kitasatospora sp. RG8]|uniref:hypothetical protein n=1 Tax=Kitasatospora sp. RG8 TaxID=2820815 RepID=UPI001AE0B32A|nr:hypothetical protein [Kitasatospora sp. RG8]MBP0454010.1 hypothetical protein [Kitasatospora sp. RG8]
MPGPHPLPPGSEQGGENPASDETDRLDGGGDDVAGLDDLVTGGLEGDGEPAVVRIGAQDGFGGVDHDRPERGAASEHLREAITKAYARTTD